MGMIEDLAARIAALEARMGMIDDASAGPDVTGAGPSMARIAARIAEFYGISVADLRGPRRDRNLAWPRQDAMAAMRDAGFTLGQIGRYLDGRDHTTILTGIRASKARMAIR
jgi:chromosomal replication initiation ATPase DnaA